VRWRLLGLLERETRPRSRAALAARTGRPAFRRCSPSHPLPEGMNRRLSSGGRRQRARCLRPGPCGPAARRQREFFIDNLLVRIQCSIHYTIVMIKWTGLAPWEFDFPFPGSLTSTFLHVPQDEQSRIPPGSAPCPPDPQNLNTQPSTRNPEYGTWNLEPGSHNHVP